MFDDLALIFMFKLITMSKCRGEAQQKKLTRHEKSEYKS